MKIIKRFPYECTIKRSVDLLNLKDDDFPLKVDDDYLRDENGNIYESKPKNIVPSSPKSDRFINLFNLTSVCDITEASASINSTVLGSKFVVSLPLISPITILRGDILDSSAFGFRINGKVLALFPSQLGINLYISDKDN